jgi:hypothetical protein
MPKDTVLSLVMRSFSILCAEALLLLSSFTLTISINTFHYLDILLYFYCCYIFIPVLPAGSQAVYVTQNSPAHSSRDGRRARTSSQPCRRRPKFSGLLIPRWMLCSAPRESRVWSLLPFMLCCGALCSCVTAWVNQLFVSASFYLHSVDCRNMLQCWY